MFIFLPEKLRSADFFQNAALRTFFAEKILPEKTLVIFVWNIVD